MPENLVIPDMNFLNDTISKRSAEGPIPPKLKEYIIFKCDFQKVVYPLTLCILFLALTFITWFQHKGKKLAGKITYRDYAPFKWVQGIPESCLLMLTGILVGLVVPYDIVDLHFPDQSVSIGRWIIK